MARAAVVAPSRSSRSSSAAAAARARGGGGAGGSVGTERAVVAWGGAGHAAVAGVGAAAVGDVGTAGANALGLPRFLSTCYREPSFAKTSSGQTQGNGTKRSFLADCAIIARFAHASVPARVRGTPTKPQQHGLMALSLQRSSLLPTRSFPRHHWLDYVVSRSNRECEHDSVGAWQERLDWLVGRVINDWAVPGRPRL